MVRAKIPKQIFFAKDHSTELILRRLVYGVLNILADSFIGGGNHRPAASHWQTPEWAVNQNKSYYTETIVSTDRWREDT